MRRMSVLLLLLRPARQSTPSLPIIAIASKISWLAPVASKMKSTLPICFASAVSDCSLVLT